ncbi:MAG: tyrosine-type recombinase/integrase [bacterium]|nr:tyrosine-type recombinase/integrase [bacterium]
MDNTNNNNNKNSILPHLDDFLLSLQSNNYSPETVYNYERDLLVFDSFLQVDLGLKDFKEASKQAVELYKAYLMSTDRKTARKTQNKAILGSFSRNRHLSSLRSYLKYLIDGGYQTPILPENIKLIKTEKKIPKVAELGELIRLIESPLKFEKNPTVAKRNHAMLEVLFATGLRISELVNLKKNQIDREGKIFVLGKGKKERFVYLTPRAIKFLKEYLAVRNDDSPHVFISYRGKRAPTKDHHVSTNYLQEKIKKYREYLGINVPTSAHSLRHGFATYLAEEGASPAAIQILLGHESLDTTTRYVHASQQFAKKTHHRFHPLKN